MSEALPPILIEILAKYDKLKIGLGEAGAEIGKFESKSAGAFAGVSKVGKMALEGVAVGAIGVGVESIKMAANFQESTTLLKTGAGETEDHMKMVTDGMLKMSGQVGTSAEELAKGMYMVESANYHGADSLKVLQAAAEGAKVGGSDLRVVADGLTTVMNNYHTPVAQAATVTSMLVTAVGQGKTTMAELASSISNVAPQASKAHISMKELLGAMATMTGQGISAAESAQTLSHVIGSLQTPTGVMTKTMAQMGLSSVDVAKNLGKAGLTGTLETLTNAITSHMGPAGLVIQSSFNQSKLAAASANEMLKQLPPSLQGLGKEFLANKITQKEWGHALKGQDVLTANLGKQFATVAKHAHGFSDALKSGSGPAKTFSATLSDMTGGSMGLKAALALTGENMGTFKDNVQKVGAATAEAGGHVKGMKETQKDFKNEMDRVKYAIQSVAIQLGTKLIPMVEAAAKFFNEHKDAAIALAAVVGGVLTIAIATYVAGLVAGAASSVMSLSLMVAGWLGYDAAVATAEVGTLSAFAAMAMAAGAAVLPFLPVIAIVAAVGFAAYELYKHWDTVWKFIKETTATAVGFIKKYATEIGAVLILLGGPIGLLVGAVIILWKNWDTVWSAIKTATSATWNVLKDIFESIVHAGLWFIKTEVQGLQIMWNTAWGAIKSVVSTVWGVIKGVFDALVHAGLWVIKSEVKGLEVVWSAIWGTIKAVVSTAWNGIKVVFNAVVQGGLWFIRSEVQGLEKIWSTVWNTIKSVVSGAWGVISGLFSSIVSGLTGLKNTITSALSDAGNWLLDVGKNIIHGLINGIKSMAMAPINAVKDIAHGIMGAITNPLKILSPSQVMHDNGVHIAQGLANGIRAGGPAAVAAAAEMARLVEAASHSGGHHHKGHKTSHKGHSAAQTAAAHAAKILAEVEAVMKGAHVSFAEAAKHIAGAVGPVEKAIEAIHKAHVAAAAKISAAHLAAAKHIEKLHHAAAQVALVETSRAAKGMAAEMKTAIASMEQDLKGLEAERKSLVDHLAAGITKGLGDAAGIFLDTTKDLVDATKAQTKATFDVEKAEQSLADLRAVQSAKKSLTVSDNQALEASVQRLTTAQEAAATATVNFGAAQATAKNPVKTLTDTLESQLLSAQIFAQQLKALATDGASQELLRNVASQGAEQGGNMAAALIAEGAGAVKGVSDLMAQISETGKTAGDAIAGQYYDQGIASVQGVIDGMKSKEAALNAEVQRISDIILQLGQAQINAAQAMSGLAAAQASTAPQGFAIGGGGSIVQYPNSGGDTNVTVMVQGSVTTQNDLVSAVRTGLNQTSNRVGAGNVVR
jgi:TP901 family phage tail tape measure protein